jgi:NADH dehydrogenase (ubiquinone) Fe-S protein 1
VNSVDSSQLKGIIGQLIDLETTYLFKEFLNKLGCSNYILQKDNSNLNIDLCSNYGMNTLIKDIEESDCCVLIGMNPRLESSMLNVRLRKRFLEGGFNIGLIGNPQNLTYDYTHLGTSTKTLLDLAEGKHSFCKTLLKSKKPMIIYNPLNLEGSNNNVYIHLINSISKNIPKLSVNEAWSGFNTFTNGANDLNSFELGISNKHKNLNSKIIYLLGADEYTLSNKEKNSFVIYQGHHGSTNAQLADIILPSLAFTEKESSYINIEGKLQETKRVYKPSHLARED